MWQRGDFVEAAEELHPDPIRSRDPLRLVLGIRSSGLCSIPGFLTHKNPRICFPLSAPRRFTRRGTFQRAPDKKAAEGRGSTTLQGIPLHPGPAEEALQAPAGAGGRQGKKKAGEEGRGRRRQGKKAAGAALRRAAGLPQRASGGSESSACGRQAAARQAAAASSLTARLWHREESSPLYLTIQT